MGQVYADRGFLSMNGVEFQDVESITARWSDGTKAVPTFSRNRRNKGVVSGNREISLSFVVAVQEDLTSPQLDNIDYKNNSVALTLEHGGDRYTFTDVHFVDNEQAASGVGAEGKKTFNMVALDVVSQKANGPLFPTALSNVAF